MEAQDVEDAHGWLQQAIERLAPAKRLSAGDRRRTNGRRVGGEASAGFVRRDDVGPVAGSRVVLLRQERDPGVTGGDSSHRPVSERGASTPDLSRPVHGGQAAVAAHWLVVLSPSGIKWPAAAVALARHAASGPKSRPAANDITTPKSRTPASKEISSSRGSSPGPKRTSSRTAPSARSNAARPPVTLSAKLDPTSRARLSPRAARIVTSP